MAKESDQGMDPLETLIRWYRAAGVDAALDERPHDRFSEAPPADIAASPRQAPVKERLPSPRPGTATVPAGLPALAAGSSDEWVAKARLAARSADSLAALRAALDNYDAIALKRTARSLLMASTIVPGGIVVLGDLPEADDERSGEIFSGRSGHLLDQMLGAIGLSREGTTLTMAVPWRPPGNRAPTAQELATLAPFLARQLSLIQPRLILAFGTSAATMLAGRRETILKLRGQWIDLAKDGERAADLDFAFERETVPMLVTLDPGHLLRHPAQKQLSWQDLKAFRARLSEMAP